MAIGVEREVVGVTGHHRDDTGESSDLGWYGARVVTTAVCIVSPRIHVSIDPECQGASLPSRDSDSVWQPGDLSGSRARVPTTAVPQLAVEVVPPRPHPSIVVEGQRVFIPCGDRNDVGGPTHLVRGRTRGGTTAYPSHPLVPPHCPHRIMRKSREGRRHRPGPAHRQRACADPDALAAPPVERRSDSGEGVSVTWVPSSKLAEQAGPQSIPEGVEVTVPPTVSVPRHRECAHRIAEGRADVAGLVHRHDARPDAEHPPPVQPLNADAPFGVAVSVTSVSASNC